MISKTGRRYLRGVLFSLLALLVIFSGGLLWASQCYRSYIKSHIAKEVLSATHGEYSASIKEVDINVFTRRITVEGLEFWPDSTHAHTATKGRNPIETTIRLSVPKFQFEGVQWLRLCFFKQLSVNHVYIWKGKLQITSIRHDVDATKLPPSKDEEPMIRKLMAETIDIIDPDIAFEYIDTAKEGFSCTLKGGKGVLKDWMLVPGQKDTNGILFAQSLIIDSSSASFYKPQILYLTKAPAIFFDSDKRRLRIKDLSIHPVVTNDEFYKKKGHRATIWNSDISSFELYDLNWQQLLYNNTLWVSRADITNPRIDLFFSYLVPSYPSNMISEDPARVFLQLPLKVNIGEITETNGTIKYTEVNERSHRAGTISFDSIDAHGAGLCNMDSIIARKNKFVMSATGLMFRKSPVDAVLTLALNDVTGNFELDGHLRQVTAQELQEPIEALAQVKIDSLQLHEMTLHLKGNQNYSDARMGMRYNTLNIKLIRAKAPPVLVEKHLVSAVANTFFIYRDNPEQGQALRTVTTHMQRDEMAPFLSLIVTNMRIAAKEMVIKHKETVGPLTNDKDLKSQRRTLLQRIFNKKKS